MRKLSWQGKNRENFEDECHEICLHQRRYDTYGRRLKTHFPEEIMAMSASERQRLRNDSWLVLPDLITEHPPKAFLPDRVVECPCEKCERARREWREQTGRD